MLNLWEVMTRAECSKDTPSWVREDLQKALNELSSRGNSGQEISIGSDDLGWLIKIHSCYSEAEVVVRLSLDPRKPAAEVVTDTRRVL